MISWQSRVLVVPVPGPGGVAATRLLKHPWAEVSQMTSEPITGIRDEH
ncbi:MAG: hypothetical protein ACXV3F_02965 [Frankiaceae bacterium]